MRNEMPTTETDEIPIVSQQSNMSILPTNPTDGGGVKEASAEEVDIPGSTVKGNSHENPEMANKTQHHEFCQAFTEVSYGLPTAFPDDKSFKWPPNDAASNADLLTSAPVHSSTNGVPYHRHILPTQFSTSKFELPRILPRVPPNQRTRIVADVTLFTSSLTDIHKTQEINDSLSGDQTSSQ